MFKVALVIALGWVAYQYVQEQPHARDAVTNASQVIQSSMTQSTTAVAVDVAEQTNAVTEDKAGTSSISAFEALTNMNRDAKQSVAQNEATIMLLEQIIEKTMGYR